MKLDSIVVIDTRKIQDIKRDSVDRLDTSSHSSVTWDNLMIFYRISSI